MEPVNCRICVGYGISTLLIGVFVFLLVYYNIQCHEKLERLRQDVDVLSHMILKSKTFDSKTIDNGNVNSNYLTDMVDNLITKRLSGILDDLHSIKQQINTQNSPFIGNGYLTKVTKENVVAENPHRERVNYASAELGAKVVSVKAEPLCPPNFFSYLFGLAYSSNPPIHMLRSNMEPGSCFAFKNSKAEFTIKLPSEVLIDQVGVQHISKFQSPTEDVSSAPKDFSISGVKDNVSILLGTFTYEINPQQLLQQFNIRTNEKYEYIRFNFLSNHGHSNYTCIYRVTVYGKL